MSKKQKLELTWVGKDERPKLEPRILIEDPSLSYCGKEQKPGGIYDNVLIKGDNLLALKALEQEYVGRVKCIFIDPPYNTGSAFEQYDDGLEHSLWLSLMRDRLDIIRNLLSPDGSLWITIDDNEAHYLKVIADEVFGRSNFIANVVWQKKYSKQNDTLTLSTSHDHILVYARQKPLWVPNKITPRPDKQKGYKNPDNDPRGPWQSVVYTCSKSRAERPNLFYPITNPKTGKSKLPKENRVWGFEEETFKQHLADNRLWWGKNGDKEAPRIKSFLYEVGEKTVPDTWWTRLDVGDNQDAKREALAFNDVEPFATPKPERLIQRILEIATSQGDIVLDSFSGSGTTGAVALKMGRRWIMAELGEHAETHVLPRIKKVIDGDDPGGVTDSTGWKGGGGFRYYTLAPSLLEKDKYDNWVISKKYDANMLAAAVCKLMGFTYEPSQDERQYWRHGYSTETDFIYVTTQSLTYDALKRLSEDVGRKRTLLVCCKAYNAKDDAFDNLTLRKIPQVVLKKCEWGRDDYSLKIAKVAPPEEVAAPAQPEPEAEAASAKPAKRTRKPRKKLDADTTPDMFAKRVEA